MAAIFFFYVLVLIAWATAGLWLTAIVWTRRELSELTPLQIISESLPAEKEPRVSILLPARNEEKRILRNCISSLLKQNYENYEIIAVNDRSTDKTDEILREVAKDNPKIIRVIEGAELPAEWLGKPFVLQQAFEKSNGEWIISTDADIVFASEAVKTAVSHALKNNYDALCLIPFDVCESFWEQVFLPTFAWLRMLKMPPRKVNDQAKAETMGVGNFFLVRRSALEKIGEFASVKMEVAEDLTLARLLKNSGASFRLDYAPDLLQTRMYAGFREIWTGFTKNLFAASNFSLLNTIFGAASILLFGVVPCVLGAFCFAAWMLTGEIRLLQLFFPLAFVYICQTTVFSALQRAWKNPLGYALLAPLGLAMFAAILVNSAIKVLTGRGVVWKGRAIYQRREAKLPTQILENE